MLETFSGIYSFLLGFVPPHCYSKQFEVSTLTIPFQSLTLATLLYHNLGTVDFAIATGLSCGSQMVEAGVVGLQQSRCGSGMCKNLS